MTADDQAELARLDGLCSRRRDHEAIAGLEALATRHPGHAIVSFLLGRALRRVGERVRAGALFAAAARRLPDDPHLQLGLAWSALDAGDLERAVALCRGAREVPALRGEALSIEAQEREAAGASEAARALFLESYEARPMLDVLAACERLSHIEHDPAGRRAAWPIGVVQRRWLFRTLESALTARSRARFGELEAMKQLTAGCDHGASLTARWAERAGVDRVVLFRALSDRGGFCDCEVCLNASRDDDADVEVLLVAGRLEGRFAKGSALPSFFAREAVGAPHLSDSVERDREGARETFALSFVGDAIEIAPQLVSDGLVADLAHTLTQEDASLRVTLVVVAPDLLDPRQTPATELVSISSEGVTSLVITRPLSETLTERLPWLEPALGALERALPSKVGPSLEGSRSRGRSELGDPRSDTRLLARGARGLLLDASRASSSADAPELPATFVLADDGSHAAWLRGRRATGELVVEDRPRESRCVLAVDRFHGALVLDVARGRVLAAAGDEIVAIDLRSGARRVIGLGEQVASAPDARTLAIARERTATITLTDADGRPTLAPFRGRAPIFSPEGRWLAYLAREDRRAEGTSYQAFVLDLRRGTHRRVGPTYDEACWLSFALEGSALVFQARVARRWIPLDDGRARLEEKERLFLVELEREEACRELYATSGGSMRIVAPLAHPRLPLVALRTQDAPRIGQRLVTVPTDASAAEHVIAHEPLSPVRWFVGA
ncbi:MAG: DUF2695 domain-containing protein [Sandaracinaceae bacterium]|nr:DUF2695 domain-containing protein [Sandaracinaceae bacterium]